MAASGVLILDKPEGPTSHDVVDEVRRLYRQKRVGHAGTLDPPASGVLLVGVCRATRTLRYYHLLEKSYEATFCFGAATTTLDAQGEVTERVPVDFDDADLRLAARRFVGEIYQTPPMVSAVKVGGERLYEKARRGERIEVKPRRQHIYQIDILEPLHVGTDGLGWARLRVTCDSGTYIRSLAADMAAALGTVGHVARLRRTAIGPFGVEVALSLEELRSMESREREGLLIWGWGALPHLPYLVLSDREAEGVARGRRLRIDLHKKAQVARSLEEVLTSYPYVGQAMRDAGILGNASKSPSDCQEIRSPASDSVTAPGGENAGRSDLDQHGIDYSGPIALLAQDGSLVGVCRLRGDILEFDCVLV